MRDTGLMYVDLAVTHIYYDVCRYASLYFCCCIEREDNELLTLEIIHRYVELLDKYFGNVCIFSLFSTSFYFLQSPVNAENLKMSHHVEMQISLNVLPVILFYLT